MLEPVKSERSGQPLATDSGAYENFNTGFFDGLRAIAAFWVLTAHCMIWSAWSGPALPSAKLAVDLFMIISGFLMAYNAHQRAHVEPLSDRIFWLKFYVRRIFRLAPVYYLALLCAVVLRGPLAGGYQYLIDHLTKFNLDFSAPLTFSTVLVHMGFLAGLVPSFTYATALPDWSLSLEAQYYLIFPALMLPFFRSRVLPIVLVTAAVCALFVIWDTGILANGDRYFLEPSFILLKLPVFLIGMLLCQASVGKGDGRQRFWLRATAMLMCLTQYPFYHVQTFWLVLIAALVLFLSTPQTGLPAIIQLRLSAALSGKLSRSCSDLSYSVYLFHGFFVAIVGATLFSSDEFVHLPNWARTTVLWTITIAGTTVVAFVVRAYVEAPGIALGRQVVEWMQPRNSRSEVIQTEFQPKNRVPGS